MMNSLSYLPFFIPDYILYVLYMRYLCFDPAPCNPHDFYLLRLYRTALVSTFWKENLTTLS